jgi:hypothetical protein
MNRFTQDVEAVDAAELCRTIQQLHALAATTTRRGVFETNSSSTHSITIVPGDFVPDTMPLEDGVCVVYPGEFGWDEESLHDVATKASYALTYAKGSRNEQELLLMLTNVLRYQTGAAQVRFRKSNDYYEWGYIDHQSNDIADEIFESAEVLRAFIFNPASCLHTDNDNH